MGGNKAQGVQRQELSIRAPDGRQLHVQVAGPQDGALVVFHTGTPGTRHLYEGDLKAGSDRGLRHACCSRPGYEGSDRQPGRSVADCAAETAAVADALGMDSFYVVGHSGGGPHALACAALLPGRVISAAVLSSFAPRSALGPAFAADFKELNHDEFAAFEKGEEALKQFLEDTASCFRKIENETQYRNALGDSLCAADFDCLAGPFLDYQLTSCARVFRDDIWGWLDDDIAIWGEWGFGLSEISTPVAIWHGKDDALVPVGNGEWLARNLPASRSHLLVGEGHISLVARYYDAVLDDLIAASSGCA